MSFLRDLLGKNYKDGMSVDDISTALESAGVVSASTMSKLKDQLTKASAEAADNKRKLRERMSEDEQKAAEAAQHLADLEAENATLKRNAAISTNTAALIGQGYSQELATKTATAMVDGDTATMLAGMSEFGKNQRTAIEQELLRNSPRPGAGSAGGAAKDYAKLIDEANAAGNHVLMAQLIRESQQTAE